MFIKIDPNLGTVYSSRDVIIEDKVVFLKEHRAFWINLTQVINIEIYHYKPDILYYEIYESIEEVESGKTLTENELYVVSFFLSVGYDDDYEYKVAFPTENQIQFDNIMRIIDENTFK